MGQFLAILRHFEVTLATTTAILHVLREKPFHRRFLHQLSLFFQGLFPPVSHQLPPLPPLRRQLPPLRHQLPPIPSMRH